MKIVTGPISRDDDRSPVLEVTRHPVMHEGQPTTEFTAFEQWEQAGAALTGAVSRFLDLSVYLEAQCATGYANSPTMVTRINSSLDVLQKTINRQLDCARIALAKTQNKLASQGSILSFPQEIMAEIFLNVIFDPPDLDRATVTMHMECRIRLIYSRLHSLLGVCTAWRDVGISCAAL
ncbi:unnamed protein product [Rhizoctonia solani]|uniref:Uncharacterized protein n=1 Tax=Rhizoctonia solani TaxID=456999 RepID=A0A8H3GNI0_9AGAM|nr:unnamed protein product [Rhizoctonia solani]